MHHPYITTAEMEPRKAAVLEGGVGAKPLTEPSPPSRVTGGREPCKAFAYRGMRLILSGATLACLADPTCGRLPRGLGSNGLCARCLWNA